MSTPSPIGRLVTIEALGSPYHGVSQWVGPLATVELDLHTYRGQLKKHSPANVSSGPHSDDDGSFHHSRFVQLIFTPAVLDPPLLLGCSSTSLMRGAPETSL